MPTWGELLLEIGESAKGKPGPDFDAVRRKYLAKLQAHTGRNVILYATRWTQGGAGDPQLVSIVPEDVHGFMEVVHGLDFTKGLDLLIHSPGGSAEAAEAIVHYLRAKFTDIRIIVPQAAMSAATMLACAANTIVMGSHSSLRPIDPQVIMGNNVSAAQAILDQFERAREECRDPQNLGAWAPILPQYGPALLKQCENALALAQDLATEWLQSWMFAGQADKEKKAGAIAKALADHAAFKSHGRPIHREAALKMGLLVTALEDDPALQDLVLSVFHATMHVFSAAPMVAKIIENHLGRAFIKQSQVMQLALPFQMQPVPAGPQPGRLSPSPPPPQPPPIAS